MGALTADRKAPYKVGELESYEVYQATKIYSGSLVCRNSSGYAIPGADTSGLLFVGVATEYVDNSLGSSGDKSVIVRRIGTFLLPKDTAVIGDVGQKAFILYDGEVARSTGVSNLIFCGMIAAIEDGSNVWVDILPGVIQSDLAAHLADGTAAHAASAIGTTDSGAYFAAATDTVEKQIQALAAQGLMITLPRFTGWTKDGTDKSIALPAFELPFACRVKRAYVNLGTAPGTGKTLVIDVNGTEAVTITETATQGEAESLDIAIAANTDFAIVVNETSAGSAANADVMLLCVRDDGE